MDAVGVQAKRQEERVKLFASALSNVGVAIIVAGFVGPVFSGRSRALVAASAFLIGFGLHLAAQLALHYVIVDTRPTIQPSSEVEE